jgi:hypothetical protein
MKILKTIKTLNKIMIQKMNLKKINIMLLMKKLRKKNKKKKLKIHGIKNKIIF